MDMDTLPQIFGDAAVVFYFHNPGMVASLRGSVGSAGGTCISWPCVCNLEAP
jgi:hypothetical protein